MDEYPKLWDEVYNDTTAGLHVYRLRVPGGFLVAVKSAGTTSVTFVAEPGHNWPLETI